MVIKRAMAGRSHSTGRSCGRDGEGSSKQQVTDEQVELTVDEIEAELPASGGARGDLEASWGHGALATQKMGHGGHRDSLPCTGSTRTWISSAPSLCVWQARGWATAGRNQGARYREAKRANPVMESGQRAVEWEGWV